MGDNGDRNSYFELFSKNDGTYMRIYEAKGHGELLLYDEISKYLFDHTIYEFDKVAIGRVLMDLTGVAEVKICDMAISSIDESLSVEIAEDRTYATARFYPPANKGSLLTKEDIISVMVRSGIKYGVDDLVILDFLKNRHYCTDYKVAKATMPIQGTDAKITYHFNTDLTLKPKRNEDGSVDFHQLDMISSCKKGDVLATLTPIDYGKPGIDVCGNIIKPLKVNNKSLRHGLHIHLSEDGLQLISDVDGHVALTDGKVFVSDTYDVQGDVDASTGDITYEGNVVVRGNVITGFAIRAKGDIEVNGVVEGAYIEAGGQIVLKRGMQGMNKGILKAGSNIITKFLENAEVIAGGYISTESILHCKVAAKGDIIVGGKRGFVTGGEIRSGTLISVKTAGSQMGTATLMEVGIDPAIIEEFHGIEKKLATMLAEKEKVAQNFIVLRKKLEQGAQISEERMKFLRQITQSNIMLDTQIKELKKRHEVLKYEIESTTSGSIVISDIVYPGTKMVISNVTYYVREPIHHSKFVRDRADIRILPLL